MRDLPFSVRIAPIVWLTLLGLLLTTTGRLGAQDSIYYIDDEGPIFVSQISRIDFPAGTITPIGQVATPLAGIDFAPDERLLGISHPNSQFPPPDGTIPSLFEIATEDAAVISETPTELDLGTDGFVADVHFDRDGRLWVLHGVEIFPDPAPAMEVSELDPLSGAVLRRSLLTDDTRYVAIGEDAQGFYLLATDLVFDSRRVDLETGTLAAVIPLEPFVGIRNFGGDSDAAGDLYFFLDVFYIESTAGDEGGSKGTLGVEGSNLVRIDPDVGVVVPVVEELAFSGSSPTLAPTRGSVLDIPTANDLGLLLLALMLAGCGAATMRRQRAAMRG